MKNVRWYGLFLAVLFSFVAFACSEPSLDHPSAGLVRDHNPEHPLQWGYAPGELLVKFSEQAPPERIQELHKKIGAITIKPSGSLGIERVKLLGHLNVEAALEAYKNDPDVEFAEPNYFRRASLAPLDPHFDRQWGLNNTGQNLTGTFPPLSGTVGADINAPEAWDIQRDFPDLVVAVIDSGVDYAHPDLSANIWFNTAEDAWSDIQNPATGDQADTDADGFVDDWKGWNFVGDQFCTVTDQNQCSCSTDDPIGNNDPMDDFGHGTPIAGIIAATGSNQEGISGVLWTAKILPLKFLGQAGCGSVGDEIEAIDFAIQKGARIITLNSGGSGFLQSEFSAIAAADHAGILVLAPAGNDQSDNDASPIYPAGYDLPNVISVGATDFDDRLAFFSNYGRTSVDLAAPGDCIFSTMPTGDFSLQTDTNFLCTSVKFNPGYDYNSGTSFSAAHVAGIAGLLLGRDPNLTPAQLKALIIGTVDPIQELNGKVLSGGRSNAYRALIRDAGSTFQGGTGGEAGCGTVFLQGGGPTATGTAIATVLILISPLLLTSHKFRKVLGLRRSRRRSVVVLIVLLFLLSTITIVHAQEDETSGEDEAEIENEHALTLKLGGHQYRTSEYFETNAAFFDSKDLMSIAAELEYNYLYHPISRIGLAVGHYGGEARFSSICCSEVIFSTYYTLATVKFDFKVKPAGQPPIRLYAGPGFGYYFFNRKVHFLNATDDFSQMLQGYHFLVGIEILLTPQIGVLAEARYTSAVIKSANELGDQLDIGGIAAFVGMSWTFLRSSPAPDGDSS